MPECDILATTRTKKLCHSWNKRYYHPGWESTRYQRYFLHVFPPFWKKNCTYFWTKIWQSGQTCLYVWLLNGYWDLEALPQFKWKAYSLWFRTHKVFRLIPTHISHMMWILKRHTKLTLHQQVQIGSCMFLGDSVIILSTLLRLWPSLMLNESILFTRRFNHTWGNFFVMKS